MLKACTHGPQDKRQQWQFQLCSIMLHLFKRRGEILRRKFRHRKLDFMRCLREEIKVDPLRPYLWEGVWRVGFLDALLFLVLQCITDTYYLLRDFTLAKSLSSCDRNDREQRRSNFEMPSRVKFQKFAKKSAFTARADGERKGKAQFITAIFRRSFRILSGRLTRHDRLGGSELRISQLGGMPSRNLSHIHQRTS